MKSVKVKLYGAFRKYAPSGEIEVPVTDGMTAELFKAAFAEALKVSVPTFVDEQLVRDSALASAETVLFNDDSVGGHAVLAILPPVCGG